MSLWDDTLARARACLTGEGADLDVRAGMALLEQAAAADHAPALVLLSDVYEQGVAPLEANRRLAFAYLDRAVELGHDEAMLRMASWYRQGWGVAVSLEKAFALNEAAAERGNATAHFNLGVAHEQGQGVSADPVKAQALSWYAVAASQGLALSQFALGAMYLDGDGVDADPVAALSWFLMSAAQDHAPFMLGVKRLMSTLPDEDVAQAGRLAEQFPAQWAAATAAMRQARH
jgi:TPR repeat protein